MPEYVWGKHINQDTWELCGEECRKARQLLRRILSDIFELQGMTQEEMPDTYQIIADLQSEMKALAECGSVAIWAATGDCDYQ